MLLDIGVGMLGALIAVVYGGVPLGLYLLSMSVLFALLPDADFLYQWARRGSFQKVDSTHRDLTHNPLIYIPVGSLVVALLDVRLVPLFIALSLFHFLHDSIGIGWGVRWAYPFSRRSYKFFSEHDGRFSLNFMTSWKPEEYPWLEELRKKRWNNKNWVQIIYLRPHPINIIELFGFLFAVALLAHYLSR